MKSKFLALTLAVFLGTAGCGAQTSDAPNGERLSKEKSPYLRQHADNVVEWYPWGEEAFAKAKAENKPVFLSVGYSTCHWCHVMEEESFMDPKIGKYLKEHFVSIKVDRETRPDVDALYMNFVQRTTGGGGWPMTVFMTPEGVPIFGGTYFPNPPRFGKTGFLDVLERIHETWEKDGQDIASKAAEFSKQLATENIRPGADELPGQEVFEKALSQWSRTFDAVHGGFKPAPKFPSPPDLEFLLAYGVAHKNSEAVTMVEKTLKAICLGGIHDHLEGGFHRYSTDEKWLVPHFEKMLYDQAQLVSLFAEQYALGGDELFRASIESTFHYLENRQMHSSGVFFSAEDADSEVPGEPEKHAEGAFYVWSYDELKDALSEAELKIAKDSFGTTEVGNATGDPTGELDGKNVLYRTDGEWNEPQQQLADKLKKLRDKRARPHSDHKVLTEWNAMLAKSYADAGRYLSEEQYLETAKKILAFIESEMVKDGQLHRSFLEGEAEIRAFATDHAQLVSAYLAVFAGSGESQALKRAIHWQGMMDEKFWDAENGAYFDTQEDTSLLYRKKSFFDGATMSANSRAVLNLATLFSLTGDKKYGDRLDASLKQIAPTLERAPTGLPGALRALMEWRGKHRSVVVVSADPAWREKALAGFHPETRVLLVTSKSEQKELQELVPFLPPWTEKSKAYICEDFACGLPITELDKLEL